MNAQKRWMETPCDIEIIRQYAQAGKLVASFGKRETIARKATSEVLFDVGEGEFWYGGYDSNCQFVPYAFIRERKVEWYAAPLSGTQMFALKRRLNLFSSFM